MESEIWSCRDAQIKVEKNETTNEEIDEELNWMKNYKHIYYQLVKLLFFTQNKRVAKNR